MFLDALQKNGDPHVLIPRTTLIDGYNTISTPNVSEALDRLGVDSLPTGIGAMWPD